MDDVFDMETFLKLQLENVDDEGNKEAINDAINEMLDEKLLLRNKNQQILMTQTLLDESHTKDSSSCFKQSKLTDQSFDQFIDNIDDFDNSSQIMYDEELITHDGNEADDEFTTCTEETNITKASRSSSHHLTDEDVKHNAFYDGYYLSKLFSPCRTNCLNNSLCYKKNITLHEILTFKEVFWNSEALPPPSTKERKEKFLDILKRAYDSMENVFKFYIPTSKNTCVHVCEGNH